MSNPIHWQQTRKEKTMGKSSIPQKRLIDLEAPPHIPPGAKVLVHTGKGNISFDDPRINWSGFLRFHTNTSYDIIGMVSEDISGQILNANVLDWLLTHKDQIEKLRAMQPPRIYASPNSVVVFGGTIYSWDENDSLENTGYEPSDRFVRGLHFNGDDWVCVSCEAESYVSGDAGIILPHIALLET